MRKRRKQENLKIGILKLVSGQRRMALSGCSNGKNFLLLFLSLPPSLPPSFLPVRLAANESVFKRYDPSKTCFKSIDKINPYLLQDIVDCYKQSRNVCRTCYYRRHVQEPIVSSGRHCKGCKKIPQPLMMIPSSKMCENLGAIKSVPVPPPPKMMLQSSSK